MAGETLTINMSLPVPGVAITTGPEYAIDINDCMTIIDRHDHSAGNGVQITPSGLNISSDLSLNNNDLINARSLRMSPQGSLISEIDDLDCLFVNGVDLYYNDGNGTNIRITDSGGVAGTPGSITGLVSPASATYVSANDTFVWESDANTAANLDAGSIIIRKIIASSAGITISAPAGLASDYTLILPTGLPASQKFMTLNASGVIAAPWSVDNTSIEISSNQVAIKDEGVTQAKLALRAVTTNGSDPGVGGISISTSSGGAFTTSAPFVAIPNMSCTITTLGRPVKLEMISDGSGTPSYWELITTNGTGRIKILRDGVEIGQHYFNNSTSGTFQFPSSSLSHIDVPSAGTYVYTLEYNVAGATQFGLFYSQMVVYED